MAVSIRLEAGDGNEAQIEAMRTLSRQAIQKQVEIWHQRRLDGEGKHERDPSIPEIHSFVDRMDFVRSMGLK